MSILIYRKLGLDLVPRIGPLAVIPQEISISSLHQVHVNSSENAKASSVSFHGAIKALIRSKLR